MMSFTDEVRLIVGSTILDHEKLLGLNFTERFNPTTKEDFVKRYNNDTVFHNTVDEALVSILHSLLKPTDKAREELKRYGITME